MNSVLIANRGEIAVRIARSCRDLGIRAIAVHSDTDAGALHVRAADEALALPGEAAADTYLSADALLAAAARAGADAIHPGYGFLAENAAFAQAVQDAGLTWVGPPPSAITAMGDKVTARTTAAAAGVPVVPGTNDPLSGADEIVAFGERHGWPVAVKAAAGGGGRGMRVIERAQDAERMLAAAAREAQASFGDATLYLERYLRFPRHIEVQVLADAHGACLAVGDRDCSIQRRHQKLLEEAPAPGLPDELRAAIADAAVAVARAVGYVGAGTVELLYEDGQFWFLEMNTRLQVEHCVTEAVTGIDLVAWQLRIAAGERLTLTSHDVAPRGHAIELRINAEDPAGGRFLPAPGPLRRLALPHGPGVRVDTGYEAGDEVSPLYDNLIAKLIAWGPDRPTAIRRAQRALTELAVDGPPTTAPALRAVLAHEDFAAVAHGTPWLESQAAELLSGLEPDPPRADGAESTKEAPAVGDLVVINGRRYWVPGATPTAAQEVVLPEPPVGVTPAPRAYGGGAGANGAPTGRAGGRAADAAPGAVSAPMQGRVLLVHVEPGQAVQEGEVVCVLEAMKMEQEIVAESGGTVAEVRVAPGDAVAQGDVLVVVEP